jgi:hypothetical protein
MVEKLAQTILEAQNIHETSYRGDAGNNYFEVDIDSAVRVAQKSTGLDDKASDLVRLLFRHAWHGAGEWAERYLRRYDHGSFATTFLGRFGVYDLHFYIQNNEDTFLAVTRNERGRDMVMWWTRDAIEAGGIVPPPIKKAYDMALFQGLIEEG